MYKPIATVRSVTWKGEERRPLMSMENKEHGRIHLVKKEGHLFVLKEKGIDCIVLEGWPEEVLLAMWA